MKLLLLISSSLLLAAALQAQRVRNVGKLQEVFAWKQLTYDINGLQVLQDRFAEGDLEERNKRFTHESDEDEGLKWAWGDERTQRPITASTVNPNDEVGRFFVQYNNVPMGVEKVGRRLFVTVPRRRYGIPATLNTIDLDRYRDYRSPPLSPYPDMALSRSLISVYRTRADECGRLWMVDTGVIEIPNNPRYLLTPSIVVFDLATDRQIMRYQLKSTDLPAANTATGLASITVVIQNGDCSDAYAYIPDLVTYGLIVYSLKQNDSWRHEHNYFHFNPTAGDLTVAGQTFQWNDGIFSLTIGAPDRDGCRPSYFHPMASTQEFQVSTCDLNRRQTNQTAFRVVGDRGASSQTTMHDLHKPTKVIFLAQIGSDALTCWRTDRPLNKNNMAVLARDRDRLSYPSDVHVTNDEVWVMANTLPRFIYSRLDTDEYNFFIYKAKIRDIISGTVCDPSSRLTSHNNGQYHNFNN